MFTPQDLQQIDAHGVSWGAVQAQLQHFRQGFPPLATLRPATPGDGILVLSPAQIDSAVACYERELPRLRVEKFVPASGAATRMFKEPLEFLHGGKRSPEVDRLLENIDKFAFWPELQSLLPAADEKTVVEYIVARGLDYGRTPKGLVSFHRYGDEVRKAVEEHLVEGAQYAAANGAVRLHFTVSPEHRAGFEALLAAKVPLYERRFGVRYRISFSEQQAKTDMLAVNPDLTPFRRPDGRLLLRPAGHGALLDNLAGIDADLVFVKNIDNVTTDARRGDTVRYKKALAGVLLALQERIFDCLMALEIPGAELEPIAAFIEGKLAVKLPRRYDTALLRAVLDRPIRVCGMVRNEGEPGGGPFWVVADELETLQIVEQHQLAPGIASAGTHFNPVDLVCSTKTSKGGRFDLRNYVDPATGSIARKSSDGRDLLAQELPGLWNGSMARWTTVFVEVPASTFTPVKIVTDLLRKEHRV